MAKRTTKRRQPLSADAPLFHSDHRRPVTRRDFLQQGFITGAGLTMGSSLFSLFANPRAAQAALSDDLITLGENSGCPIGAAITGKIPFICFDLAGGANVVGSNVLAGGQGGYINSPIGTAGYSKMGIPGDMVPGGVDTNPPLNGPNEDTITSLLGDFTDTTLGLPFHSDSAYLRGILNKTDLTLTAPFVNGAVIPARSDNDTGNNPHNPMYGIAKAGRPNQDPSELPDGDIVTLVGSRNSESGGNSMSPSRDINPEIRPTKVDRPSDVTGLVDTGDLTAVLSDPEDVKAVMESVVRLSEKKAAIGPTAVVQDLMNCGYLKAADIAERFVGVPVDPATDPTIVGATGIFSQAEFNGDGEFRKTASVMKMVIDGHAGAGTIQMGGFDYHTGDRSTGEVRDLRAGRCIGACLEYARRKNTPVMIYVFSDGSVASNGALDGTVNGRGKGVWTGDNSSTAAGFFLVLNPGSKPTLFNDPASSLSAQIGWFNSGGSVVTSSAPSANNVNLLVDTVLLNYLALHGDEGLFDSIYGNSLGSAAVRDSLTAFGKITA